MCMREQKNTNVIHHFFNTFEPEQAKKKKM